MTQKDKLVEYQHDYDGIEEYDNPSPGWWNYLFYGAIIFSAWYMAFYFGKGNVLKSYKVGEEGTAWSAALYETKQQAALAEAAKQAAILPEGDELAAYLKSTGAISRGERHYQSNCLSCHSENGQGLVGPNLVDDHWIHGWTQENIIASIANGFPEKGMVAWKPVLGMKRVYDLTAYVMSIEGKQVSNPKAPEGEKKQQ